MEHNPNDREEFIADVTKTISTDKPKVVIVVSDSDEDEESMTFTVMFDPPFDNNDADANPDVFGVAAGFVKYMNHLMGNDDFEESPDPDWMNP